MALTHYSKRPFKDVEHFINADGRHIFCRCYKPENEIKGLLLFLHGHGEHCGRFENLAKIVNELDFLMFTHDHEGHGESEGSRGSFNYEVFVRDAIKHAEIMKKKYPGLPMFIYGHSLGGGVTVATVHQKPNFFKGMLLSAPLITASPELATPLQYLLVKLLSWLFPNLIVGQINLDHLSRDPKAQREYAEDPMVYTEGLKAGAANECLRMVNDLSKMLRDIKIPYFVGHGGDDKICSIDGSKLLIVLSRSDDKRFMFYPDMRHQLEHELEKDTNKYLGDVKEWLVEHINT